MPWKMEIFDEHPAFDFGLDFTPELRRFYDSSSTDLFDHGYAVLPDWQPFRFAQRSDKADYPDLFQGRYGGHMVMSARMRAVVESLAPPEAGLQFVPVVIERPDGLPGPGGYAFFKVVDLVDAIIPERSEVTPVYFRGQFRRYDAWIGAKVAFREDVIAGRHVWVDKHLKRNVYVSDEMRSAMMAAGLTGVTTGRIDPA